MSNCRCGWDGRGDHPCHGSAYACRRPARSRFVTLGPAHLAGVQVKLGAYQTFACDECWQAYQKIRNPGGIRPSTGGEAGASGCLAPGV